MNKVVRIIDAVNEAAGKFSALLIVLLVAVMVYLVIGRYLFSAGSIATQELSLWLFSASFMLSFGYAFKHQQHVRVDVFSQRWQPQTRAWLEFAGIVFLLLPLCIFWFWVSLDYVAASWSQKEGSNSGGLPGWYLIKTCIPISAALIVLQAFAQALRAWRQTKTAEKIA
jgi:TRAP-type mannitol/chloroaromatic compound transport system permease small subunit